MNKIYELIAELSEGVFIRIGQRYSKDSTAIKDAVQECCLYLLQMNPETLKKIYDKDGEKGLIGYSAVVIKRSLTSIRSPFYYKYKKYYTNLTGVNMTPTSKNNFHKSIYNLPDTTEINEKQIKLEKIDSILDDVYWYDSKVFQLYYYESNTLDSLARKTGISRNSLFTTIDKVREYIKEKVDE